MNLGKYIYGLLSTTSDITDLVGSRIYPIFIPQDDAYPAISYTISNAPLDRNMKGQSADHDKSVATFRIWADAAQGQQTYDDLESIDSAIRAALDNVEGTVNGVTVESCRYEGSQDGRDEDRVLFLREAIYTFITKN